MEKVEDDFVVEIWEKKGARKLGKFVDKLRFEFGMNYDEVLNAVNYILVKKGKEPFTIASFDELIRESE